ncbi:hypothetical protein, partial [Ralstonia solanacearum]|uniref:hypothetical protein n=1 Tax=Ralstonia solanacearum TaxID=305 RepID=UPI002306588D
VVILLANKDPAENIRIEEALPPTDAAAQLDEGAPFALTTMPRRQPAWNARCIGWPTSKAGAAPAVPKPFVEREAKLGTRGCTGGCSPGRPDARDLRPAPRCRRAAVDRQATAGHGRPIARGDVFASRDIQGSTPHRHAEEGGRREKVTQAPLQNTMTWRYRDTAAARFAALQHCG